VTSTLSKHQPTEEFRWPAWLGGRSWLDWSRLPAFMTDLDFKVEEFKEDDRLVVRAELPGIDPERDVDISVSDHVLEIRAERRQETHVDEKDGYRTEFRYGSFLRSFRLPKGATEDDIEATYKDGILQVKIPLDDSAAESRHIAVARQRRPFGFMTFDPGGS
jgi:HSP20 family protein